MVEYLGYGNLQYHAHVFPSERPLHDSIIYEYNSSLGIADSNDCAEVKEPVIIDVEFPRKEEVIEFWNISVIWSVTCAKVGVPTSCHKERARI